MYSTIFATTGTEKFAWFYNWGDYVFFAVCVGLILLIFLHSYYKEISALLYRILSLLMPILLIPSLVFSISKIELQTTLSRYISLFFIFGIISLALLIIITLVYFLISRSDPKGEYCDIHKTHYKEGLCPICALDFELASNNQYDDGRTISEKSSKDVNVKGFLINTVNSKVYNLVSSNLIGRGSEKDGNKKNVNIENDQFVSRIHARVIYDGRRFKLSDSSSSSGTFLNGNKISGWVTLEDGDLIKVGKTVLKFTKK